MQRAKQTGNHRALYASGSDFCRIFEKDMNRLYRLSLMLTIDREMAEKCFVGGLEESKNSNPVFKEWAESWARRTIIQNAIKMVGPRPGTDHTARPLVRNEMNAWPAELTAIAELPEFDRFVFVMTVLERFSDQECSLLLGCARSDVVQARSRALTQIGRSAELCGRLISIESNQASRGGDAASALPLGVFPHLAASA